MTIRSVFQYPVTFYIDHNSVFPLANGSNTVTSLFAFTLLYNLDMQQGISTMSSGTTAMTGDTNTQVNFLL